MTENDAQKVVARAEQSVQALRSDPPPQSLPDQKLLSSGVAASNEIGILVLQRLGELKGEVRAVKDRLHRIESAEDSALGAILEERRSKIDLEEEVTRTDLFLKKNQAAHREKIITRVLAAIMTPGGLWAFWQWIRHLIE